MGRKVHYDEAIAIVERFLEQVEKDYTSHLLRFSVLMSERQHYDSAEDFIFNKTAILWGREGDKYYLSFGEMCDIIDVDQSFIMPVIVEKHRRNGREFLFGRRKERMTRRGVNVVGYVNVSNPLVAQQISQHLRDIGVLPINTSLPLPRLPEGIEELLRGDELLPFTNEDKKKEEEEVAEGQEEEEEDIEEEEESLEDRRKRLRRQADRSLFLLCRSDIAIFSWIGIEDRFRLVSELAIAYMLHIPIFIIYSTVFPMPDEIITYGGRFFRKVDDLILSVKEVVGSGRSKVVGPFTKRKVEELLK